MATTIGIAGITSKLARLISSHLLKNPEIKIKGYCRDPSKVSPTLSNSSQVQILEGTPFDVPRLQEFVQECSIVICCYMADDKVMIDGQKALIDICDSTRSVTRYMASDWTIDYTKLEFGQIPSKDPMKHIKAYVDTKTNLKGVHILTGAMIEGLFSPFFNIYNHEIPKFQFWGTGKEIWEWICYDDCAAFTAKVVLDESAVGFIRVIGDRASISDIVKTYEKVYNVQAVTECLGAVDDLAGVKLPGEGEKDITKVYEALSRMFLYRILKGQVYVGPEVDNSKYPDVKVKTIEEWMKGYAREELAVSWGKAADRA